MRRTATLAPRRPSGWTVEEYYQLLECGALGEDDHVELLGGAIVAGEPQSPRHASTISRLQRFLDRRLGDRAIVRAQLDHIAGHRSAPEPDLAIVPLVDDWYAAAHPSRAHAVFEVAVSSLLQDRLTKGPIYAGNGVPQYVLVNLRDRCVENHTRPNVPRRRTPPARCSAAARRCGWWSSRTSSWRSTTCWRGAFGLDLAAAPSGLRGLRNPAVVRVVRQKA